MGSVVEIPDVGFREVVAVRTPADLVSGLNELEARDVVYRIRAIAGDGWQERYFEMDYKDGNVIRTTNAKRMKWI